MWILWIILLSFSLTVTLVFFISLSSWIAGYVQGPCFLLTHPYWNPRSQFCLCSHRECSPKATRCLLFGLISEVMCDTLDAWWSVSATLLSSISSVPYWSLSQLRALTPQSTTVIFPFLCFFGALIHLSGLVNDPSWVYAPQMNISWLWPPTKAWWLPLILLVTSSATPWPT